MDNEKMPVVTLDGTEYPLKCTTKALNAIYKRYGGLQEMSKVLSAGTGQIDDLCYLLALLANQPIEIHNVKAGPSEKLPLLTPEHFEILTDFDELTAMATPMREALSAGFKRLVKSEEVPADPQTA